MDYFFDSYAIIEIIRLNESYLKFAKSPIITNILHLAEVYYFLLRNYNERTADYWIKRLNFSFLDMSHDIATAAAKLKYKNRKLKLSYADCIGYLTAQRYGVRFLTGDRQFESMRGVEFVK
jgi:predicted nucleic acid-binding protein